MRMLIGFFCAAAIALAACNSEPKVESKDADIVDVEPAAVVTEATSSDLVDLREELKEVEEMLKNHMEQLETSIESANTEAKDELVEKKKEVQEWSNKVGYQLQKLSGDLSGEFASFKSDTEDLFEEIENYFKEEVEVQQ